MSTDTQQRDLYQLAWSWRQAQRRERERMAELRAAIQLAALTMSEAEIVRATQINRVTVRRAMGKDRRDAAA